MTQIFNGVEFTEEHGYIHIDFSAGFDCVSSAPGGGYLRDISRISFGDYEDCDLSIPCPRPETVRTGSGEFGRTRVFAVAYSDLNSGLGRAAEVSEPGDGMTHVLVIMDCDTPEYGMLRATVTANEAVTAVVQDLLLRSDGGSEPASGSVCQSVTVVRNRNSDVFLHGAGKHGKLGQLIGETVMTAVRESASANGKSCESASDAMEMLGMYGYSHEDLFNMTGCRDLNAFSVSLDRISMEPHVAASVSAVLFVADEIRWKLIPEEDGLSVISGMMKEVFGYDDEVGNPAEDIARALAAMAAGRI